MSLSDYTKAYKLGKKNYQYRMLHGQLPTLEVLDDIIPSKGTFSEVPLGLVQIPIDQIVGTVNSLSPQVTLYQSTWYRAYDQNLDGVLCSATGYVDFCDVYWKE